MGFVNNSIERSFKRQAVEKLEQLDDSNNNRPKTQLKIQRPNINNLTFRIQIINEDIIQLNMRLPINIHVSH